MSKEISFPVMGVVPGKWIGRLNCLMMGYLLDMKDENKYPNE
jgi:hypothetical protein